jgi:hypothetical protein
MTIDQRLEFLIQSAESHDRQIGDLADQVSALGREVSALGRKVDAVTQAVGKLVIVSNEDATAIRTLARIAEAHDRRISKLEETH